MLNLAKIIKPWQESGALNAQINLYGFWNENTFLTKSGDMGTVLKVEGIDYESLDKDSQVVAVNHLEAALKTFTTEFRIYQYLHKTSRPHIPFEEYGDPLVDAAIDQRKRYFEAKAGSLYQIDIYYVIVYEKKRAKRGIRPALSHLSSDPGRAIKDIGALLSGKQMTMLLKEELNLDTSILHQRVSGPVWIMPISLVAEHFDPATSQFDVVIIDEASQADLNALIPLYMGKQVIVVGDHEQVTPLGVGKDITLLENLRKSMLQDIPNSHLFDNQSSIYDIGRQSFGDAIRLVEHFRCVPEIIAFSNQLSYGGTIRPLRESNSTHIKPACVSHRVEGVRDGDTNKREAEQIVALIKAMTKHQAYAGKTIGVISMVKESQAALIQSLLHKEIDSVEIEKRRIQAGISSEFQGDERDIMFLSMVDSQSDEGPLRTTGEGAFELTKKRYNVAVSRARDQLWVVHSFDPDLHLKTADLRFRLLQHVKDPLASIRAFDEEAKRTESPFEREVLKLLLGAGYCVKTQWQVGYFRIDMVVEGGAKRLAVECDGDRYHPIEKLAEDVERQAILERLGWKFIRIRGSAFYRDPNLAMQAVFSKLEELGIPPEGNGGEAPLSDMTLIHELIALVNENAEAPIAVEASDSETADLQFEDGDLDLEQNVLPDFGAFAGGMDRPKYSRVAGAPGNPNRGQVEMLLETFGGTASLPDFMRHLAKIRGYQRVGRIVRKSLQSEIAALRRKGKVSIENGTIRLAE